MPSRVCRTVALVALAATVVSCGGSARPVPVLAPPSRAETPDRIRVRAGSAILTVPLEEYVIDTILAEVSPVGEQPDVAARIFEVQAIVARTYALSKIGRHRAEGFDVCDTTHCQVYDPARRKTSRFAAAAAAAVAKTRGDLLAYQARPIEALFHADCGGSTAAADAVWGGAAVPYLQAAKDDVPESAHRPWRVAASIEDVRRALNNDPRTTVGRALESIAVATRDDSGRAAGLTVRGERSYTVRGDVLRTVLNRHLGARALLSTRFSVTREGGQYVFDGTGFGHGVGLCQRGAAARARRGDTVKAILRAYYPDTDIK